MLKASRNLLHASCTRRCSGCSSFRTACSSCRVTTAARSAVVRCQAIRSRRSGSNAGTTGRSPLPTRRRSFGSCSSTCRCRLPSWWLIVAANVLLGANQGLAWSMTVVMKIDLAGPERRGLALGLNESAGYLGVAATAFATGAIAASVAPRTVVWTGALAISLAGTAIALVFVRDTGGHVAHEQLAHGEREALPLRAAFAEATIRRPVLRACSQAGLVNNLNDALAWGLA